MNQISIYIRMVKHCSSTKWNICNYDKEVCRPSYELAWKDVHNSDILRRTVVYRQTEEYIVIEHVVQNVCSNCVGKSQFSRPDWNPLKVLLTRLALGWILGSWNTEGLHHPDWWKWLTVPKLCVQTTWFILNLCFPSGSLKWWYVPVRGCLCAQFSIKTLGIESLKSFPRR